MPFPTVSTGRKDGQLSNISLAYTNEEYIHSKIMPVVPNLKDESGFIGEFLNNHLRIYSTGVKRGVWDRSQHNVEYKIDNSKTYLIEFYDLDMYVPDRLKSQFQAPFDAKRDALLNLEIMREQIMEDALATALADSSVLTNTSTPGSLWSDFVNSDPLGDITTALESVRSKTGRYPNKAWTNAPVLMKLMNHPQFIERISGVQKTLSKFDIIEIIKAHTGLKDIFVGSAIYINTQEGQSETKADMWQDDFGVYYSPDSPSLMTPSFGYRFELAGQGKRVVTRRDPGDKGDIVELDWAYQDKILDVNAAYLLDQVIT